MTLDRALIDSLFPPGLPEPATWEQRFPPRPLPSDALVTRLGPSPTGSLHLGGAFVAMIDKAVSQQSGGTYVLRIEDTDQARVVPGAVEQFARVMAYLRIEPDELEGNGSYGPYRQSQRAEIYATYARELLRQDKAYLCFATPDELASIRARQQDAKVPTGYYGRWAIWRDAAPADVAAKLEEGVPYVVRFRSPAAVDERVRFVDLIRGQLDADANRNDAVILKSSAVEPRLPTYHFAHAVDDHLMRINLVIRGDEWISSVPLHLQLFEALGLPQMEYAHLAPLMKQAGGSKRKLSKRHDPEASIDFYVEGGYPADAVLYYLRGLANGRLAELPLAEALAAPISLADCGVAGPLMDLVKLDDICADHVATMSGQSILSAVTAWAAEYDAELASVLEADSAVALAALAVEREGVENPRKDLRKWADFRPVYGFFFAGLFAAMAGPDDPRVAALGLSADVVRKLATEYAPSYQPLDDPQAWFDQIRSLADRHGFAPNAKAYKAEPDRYPGSVREVAQLVRVALTGSTRSPDLFAIAQVLGVEEVRRRVLALT